MILFTEIDMLLILTFLQNDNISLIVNEAIQLKISNVNMVSNKIKIFTSQNQILHFSIKVWFGYLTEY